IGATGVALIFVQESQAMSMKWSVIVGIKVAIFVAALCLFVYTSWRLWPARLFASREEIPKFQRLFRWISITMITFAALGMSLGILGSITA
ncbi:MAG: hypothetical protein MN733_19875, partial [Nitrososphaera sp.]|nr:hypothetical protein [Nitrososphaera sp.]